MTGIVEGQSQPPGASLEVTSPWDQAFGEMQTRLGSFIFRWLQASSVFPAIRLPITLHLGAALARADGRSTPSETEVISLIALPWFRQGWMPNDLRKALIVRLSDTDRVIVRNALAALTFTMMNATEVDKLGGTAVVRVLAAPADWVAHWAAWRRGLPRVLAEHDTTLVEFVEPSRWTEKERQFVLAAVRLAKSPAVSLAKSRLLAFIGVLAILGAIAAAVFFFGGFYNVAVTEEDPAIVNWALARIRQASIVRHATDTPPMSLDDPAVVQAGARAFSERGCVNCHGAPGVIWDKFSEGLRPDPPDLKELADELRPQDLFWVIKNGIHMTGMPSFGLIEVPDQEIWTIVAFVKKLPSVTDADFKAWSSKP